MAYFERHADPALQVRVVHDACAEAEDSPVVFTKEVSYDTGTPEILMVSKAPWVWSYVWRSASSVLPVEACDYCVVCKRLVEGRG